MKSLKFSPDPLATKTKSREKSSPSNLLLLFTTFILVSSVNALDFTCPNPREFTIASFNNIRGNALILGNTNLCFNTNGSCGDPGNRQNNNIDMMNNGSDSTTSITTFNHSSATFTLSETSTIEFAKLYWQGYLVNEDNATKESAGKVLFKTPTTDYIEINSSTDKYEYNWVYFNATRYYYQASADVTDMVKNAGNGKYSVANIVSELGKPIGGSYGGWSLVIVYKDEKNETYKNVTIYDGYRAVSTSNDEENAKDYALSNNCTNVGVSNKVTVQLSGFLTPTNGEVKSFFSVFAGEGDKGFKGDHIQLTDKNGVAKYIANGLNLFNDIFNSTITNNGISVTDTTSPISIDPWYSNNSNGLDIDTFNASKDTNGASLIGNEQKSTNVTLDTTGDGYFPGVFAFSTELYEPRVCYFIDTIKQQDDNTTIFEDKKFISEIEADKEYTFDIWISNMKKSSTDTFLETAKLVQVYMDMVDINYTASSMVMQNLGSAAPIKALTDSSGDDEGEFAPTTNQLIWNVGQDASGSQGGTIAPAANFYDDTKKAFITYKGKFVVDANTTSIDLLDFFKFKAAFKTDSITVGSDNAQIIDQCQDLNTSANVIRPPRGAFNIVNENFSGSSIDNETDSALFTQVSGQAFDVKVLALDNDFSTLINYTGDVNLSIIVTPEYTGDSIGDQVLCDNALASSPQTINFVNENSKTQSISVNNAVKKASFKVSFMQSGSVRHVCSTDNFAVRPSKYTFSFSPTPLVGGKDHTITTTALNQSNSQTTSYEHLVGDNANQSINLLIPPGCTGISDSNSSLATFSGGIDSSLVRTGNIGDYNLTMSDDTWSSVDIGTTHGDDCIVGSFINTPSSGKVGCNIQTSQTIFFGPKDFANTLTIANANAGTFTYLSNDANMSAAATVTVTARLEDNSTASAYSANCYANDITMSMTLLNNPSPWLNGNPDAINRILYFDDANVTSSLDSNASGEGNFTIAEGNFTSGVANISVGFNFNRDVLKADEPFLIAKNDFNLSIIDTNGTAGNDFDRTTDQNATFYYGRAHAPDYTFAGDNGTARIYYEVYCKDCNRTDLNISNTESVDSIDWYQNLLHVDSAGKSNPIPNQDTEFSNFSAATNNPFTDQTLVLRGGTIRPFVDKVNLNPPSWLKHYPTDFTVEFLGKGDWAGAGRVSDSNISGVHTHDSAPNRVNKRIEW